MVLKILRYDKYVPLIWESFEEGSDLRNHGQGDLLHTVRK